MGKAAEKYPLQERLFLGLILFLTSWGQGRKTNTFLKASYSTGTHCCILENAETAISELIEVETLTWSTNVD